MKTTSKTDPRDERLAQLEAERQALLPRDADARARYLAEREHKLGLQDRERKADAFAAAVRAGESERASEMLLAELGYTERLAMIQAVDGVELVAWLRDNVSA